MNRSFLRPGTLAVASALALSLVACGQGTGPGTAPATADVTTDDGVQTLVELTPEPTPTEAPPATPDPGPPSPATPDLVTLTVVPAAEDCAMYNPENLTVVASGGDWQLRAGNKVLLRFATAADAEDGKRVARNWRQLCFIGAGSPGPDHRHIVNYFKAPSGQPLGVAPATIDCITYNPNDLQLHEGPSHPARPDHPYWSVYSGSVRLMELDNYADALRAQAVAAGYTRLCFIGAGNDRPDPYQYRVEWWRA